MRLSRTIALFAAFCGAALFAGCGATGSAVAPLGSNATPGPSPSPTIPPSPTPTPIQLVLGTTVGTQMGWPGGDTSSGGNGQAVDGIQCQNELLGQYHHHVHLSIFVNGTQLWIPKGTGMFHPGAGKSGFIYHAQCYYWLHTHDQTGIIHIEPPNGNRYTLKQWFDIWGEPLSTTNVAGYTGNVGVYVNGMFEPGQNPATIGFTPYEEITLVIGTAPPWVPQYVFPPGYP